MKRLIYLITAVYLAALLAGCNYLPGLPRETTTPATTTEPTNAAPTAEPTEPSTEVLGTVTKTPMAAVALPVQTETAAAADGTEIFRYTYQNISLIAPDPEVADLVIVDFLNRIDATRDTAKSIHTMAETAYSGNGSFSPYLCMISWVLLRQSGLISPAITR